MNRIIRPIAILLVFASASSVFAQILYPNRTTQSLTFDYMYSFAQAYPDWTIDEADARTEHRGEVWRGPVISSAGSFQCGLSAQGAEDLEHFDSDDDGPTFTDIMTTNFQDSLDLGDGTIFPPECNSRWVLTRDYGSDQGTSHTSLEQGMQHWGYTACDDEGDPNGTFVLRGGSNCVACDELTFEFDTDTDDVILTNQIDFSVDLYREDDQTWQFCVGGSLQDYVWEPWADYTDVGNVYFTRLIIRTYNDLDELLTTHVNQGLIVTVGGSISRRLAMYSTTYWSQQSYVFDVDDLICSSSNYRDVIETSLQDKNHIGGADFPYLYDLNLGKPAKVVIGWCVETRLPAVRGDTTRSGSVNIHDRLLIQALDGTDIESDPDAEYEFRADFDDDGDIDDDDLDAFDDEFCVADMNSDQQLNVNDYITFQSLWNAHDTRADFNGSGTWTINDYIAYQARYNAGCSF